MKKQEFEDRLQQTVSDDDYKVIEHVYTFYPTLSEVDGKNQIVTLFKIGGMRLMHDMYPSAILEQSYKDDIKKKEMELYNLRESYKIFRMEEKK